MIVCYYWVMLTEVHKSAPDVNQVDNNKPSLVASYTACRSYHTICAATTHIKARLFEVIHKWVSSIHDPPCEDN